MKIFSKTKLSVRKLIEKLGPWTFRLIMKNVLTKSLRSAGSLRGKQYKKIKAVGSRPPVLYGFCKVHRAIVDVSPLFKSILSAI